MTGIEALLTRASHELSDATPRLSEESLARAGPLAPQLLALLFRRNGFYAFESSLHVWPSDQIDAWNATDLWRSAYDNATSDALFFAEDAFAHQWCIVDGVIRKFDPEDAVMQDAARSLDGWATRMLDDYEVETGWPLMHEWQLKFGPLPEGRRLATKIPIFLGGLYDIENLYAAPTVSYLRYCGDIWHQTRNAPNGAPVELRIVP
jgi:hypothetical protein